MAKRSSSRKTAKRDRRKPTRGRPQERHAANVKPLPLSAADAGNTPSEEAREFVRGVRLTGGDPDADWRRADSVGEEAVGGTVATPDQDSVDALGDALGVPRGPDEELRSSTEILEGRDRYRAEQET